MIAVGAPAPDFELPDHHGVPVSLSGLRGGPVVLVFFPFAFTNVCSGELRAIRDDLVPTLEDTASVVAVSCDSMYAQRVFADQEGLEFPLLSDFWPHGEVASAYGVFDADRGCARRGSFVIDSDGMVRWQKINALPDVRDVGEYRRALDTMVIG